MSEQNTQNKSEDTIEVDGAVINVLPLDFTNEQWIEHHKKPGGDLTDPAITPPIYDLYTRVMPEIDRVFMEWCESRLDETEANVAAQFLTIHMLTRLVRLTAGRPEKYLIVGQKLVSGINGGFGRLLAQRMLEDIAMPLGKRDAAIDEQRKT